ncbi:PilW family protein [Halomonas huangheensis]|uniref:Prepilin-type N-terminal cleavage/methylation domain-containing protein n=1 Tax=Halomonas huangheensis TaxID=1178482 RepID=W1N2G9_9GAMM|nr:prepilin-type N-terminal cleavage/methylation domain-containing protein [Halomonas huangheensis]ALM51271.1 hypothetical protein AR456_02405 [Halomonas huangheensis]ERL49698.1 hypothetical protein BJB45_00845 [Halomonas huangheensis]
MFRWRGVVRREGVMGPRHQRGLSLVELMVAMLIGSMVMLAATRVMHNVLQSDQHMRQLSERQAVISYALDIMAARLRSGSATAESFVLRDSYLDSRYSDDRYLGSSRSDGRCTLHDNEGHQPLIDGLISAGECGDERVIDTQGDGIYRLHLKLADFPAPLMMWVVDRRHWSDGSTP